LKLWHGPCYLSLPGAFKEVYAMNNGMNRTLTTCLAALVAAALVAGGCKRTEEGKVVADEQAQAKAREQVARAADATEQGIKKAGEAVDEGLEKAGQALDRASAALEPRVADATLTARVKARLIADPEVNALAIDVDTVNGVVTLNGRVKTEAQRAEAVELARGTEGVHTVNDLIQVEGSV
jgi:osmotically-inducible protein OsmY